MNRLDNTATYLYETVACNVNTITWSGVVVTYNGKTVTYIDAAITCINNTVTFQISTPDVTRTDNALIAERL